MSFGRFDWLDGVIGYFGSNDDDDVNGQFKLGGIKPLCVDDDWWIFYSEADDCKKFSECYWEVDEGIIGEGIQWV